MIFTVVNETFMLGFAYDIVPNCAYSIVIICIHDAENSILVMALTTYLNVLSTMNEYPLNKKFHG